MQLKMIKACTCKETLGGTTALFNRSMLGKFVETGLLAVAFDGINNCCCCCRCNNLFCSTARYLLLLFIKFCCCCNKLIIHTLEKYADDWWKNELKLLLHQNTYKSTNLNSELSSGGSRAILRCSIRYLINVLMHWYPIRTLLVQRWRLKLRISLVNSKSRLLL